MKDRFLTKNTTTTLHGIAILMLIYHHLFIYGNIWSIDQKISIFDIFNGLNVLGVESAQINIARFCRICVAVFAFTSGYAMFVQFEDKCKDKIDIKQIIKYCVKRLLSFYKKYFLCALFFISFEYILNNPHSLNMSLRNIVLNLLGFDSSLNTTWWYVNVYYFMIVLSPLFYLVLKKINSKGYILLSFVAVIIAVISFISGNGYVLYKTISAFIQNPTMIYIIIFAEGMFCARYLFLEKLELKMNIILDIVILIATYLLRTLLIRADSDCLFDILLIVPFVFSITFVLKRMPLLNKLFEFLGKHSTYMWLSHAYFYVLVLFPIVIRNNYSIIIYVQVIAYSLITSLLFTALEKTLGKIS